MKNTVYYISQIVNNWDNQNQALYCLEVMGIH